MNLLMADRTILVPRRTQIMERRGNYADDRIRLGRSRRSRQIRVAVQADKPDLLVREHARIRRTVRFVAGCASFEADRGVVECEWPALIGVALEAPRFIRCEAMQHVVPECAMRIVTVHAGDCALHDTVSIRLLELRPDRHMTCGAQLVNGAELARDESEGSIGVNLMTRGACHLVLRMAALDRTGMGRVAQMACQTHTARLRRRELGWIADVLG